MIDFNYETDFLLEHELKVSAWISSVISQEHLKEGEINYVFCDDDYLHKLNVEFLNHDTLTDIISFDYTMGKLISGDIFISIERVKENAIEFGVGFFEELHRVIIHGILHFCGYKDKTDADKLTMRTKENYYLNTYTVV